MLDRGRGNVDDTTKLARDHLVDRRTNQLDRCQHIGVHRGDPVLTAPVTKIAWLGSASIGHQNVGIRTDRQDFGAPLGCRDVCGNGGDLDACLGANRRSRSL